MPARRVSVPDRGDSGTSVAARCHLVGGVRVQDPSRACSCPSACPLVATASIQGEAGSERAAAGLVLRLDPLEVRQLEKLLDAEPAVVPQLATLLRSVRASDRARLEGPGIWNDTGTTVGRTDGVRLLTGPPRWAGPLLPTAGDCATVET